MRVAICSSCVPFIQGGGRFIVDWLAIKLREHGHEVEIVYLPFVETFDEILPQFMAYRLLDLAQTTDRIITLRPPSHLIPHPNKIVWFIHHLRRFYDLWDTPYRDCPDNLQNQALRARIWEADRNALGEARRLFTNSQVVADRIKKFNGLDSEVLYPPLLFPEQFHCHGYGDEVLYLGRVESHKRQHLLVEAFRHVRTAARLRICGVSASPGYAHRLRKLISRNNLGNRVSFDNRWISEEEKRDLLAGALLVAYLPEDEDSYGYPSLEASYARKALLTTTDAGGVLELVRDGINGRIVESDPAALGAAIDALYRDRAEARRLGEGAHDRLGELRINWDHVVEKMLS